MFEEESGMPMWKEWKTSVSQRSLELIVHRECAAEADQRSAGRKVSTKLPRPKLWKIRSQPIVKIKKKKKKITVIHILQLHFILCYFVFT